MRLAHPAGLVRSLELQTPGIFRNREETMAFHINVPTLHTPCAKATAIILETAPVRLNFPEEKLLNRAMPPWTVTFSTNAATQNQ